MPPNIRRTLSPYTPSDSPLQKQRLTQQTRTHSNTVAVPAPTQSSPTGCDGQIHGPHSPNNHNKVRITAQSNMTRSPAVRTYVATPNELKQLLPRCPTILLGLMHLRTLRASHASSITRKSVRRFQLASPSNAQSLLPKQHRQAIPSTDSLVPVANLTLTRPNSSVTHTSK